MALYTPGVVLGSSAAAAATVAKEPVTGMGGQVLRDLPPVGWREGSVSSW